MALEKRQGAPQLSGAWDWNWERVTVFGCGRAEFAVTEYPGQTVTPCWERSAHPAHDNPSVLKAVPAEQPAAELIFIQALLSPLSQALQPQHVLGVCCGVVGTDLNPTSSLSVSSVGAVCKAGLPLRALRTSLFSLVASVLLSAQITGPTSASSTSLAWRLCQTPSRCSWKVSWRQKGQKCWRCESPEPWLRGSSRELRAAICPPEMLAEFLVSVQGSHTSFGSLRS